MKKLKLIINIFCFGLTLSINAQELSTKEYIKNNIEIFEATDSSILQSAYDNYKLFAIGEYHFREENSKIFLSVFSNLYKYANVRLIIMEASMAHGLLVEHYLETGDIKSLKLISVGQFDEFHYRKLKDMYDSLPENDKFHVIAVDIDNFDMQFNLKYTVEMLFENTTIPNELTKLLADFDSIANSEDYAAMNSSFYKINYDFTQHSELYRDSLGINFLVYKELLDRQKKSLRFDYYDYNRGKDSVEHSRRENFIYNNVVSGIKKYPDCNYFGQFGVAHIGLSRFLFIKSEDHVESFITKLNNRQKSPLNNKICSMAILYFEDYIPDYNKLYYYYSEASYSSSRKNYLPKNIYKTIKDNAKVNCLSLVNLSKTSSPLKEFSKNNFQYLIFKR
jgi:hypothetical protein